MGLFARKDNDGELSLWVLVYLGLHLCRCGFWSILVFFSVAMGFDQAKSWYLRLWVLIYLLTVIFDQQSLHLCGYGSWYICRSGFRSSKVNLCGHWSWYICGYGFWSNKVLISVVWALTKQSLDLYVVVGFDQQNLDLRGHGSWSIYGCGFLLSKVLIFVVVGLDLSWLWVLLLVAEGFSGYC